MAAGQFSEILVEGDQHTAFALRLLKNSCIWKAWSLIPNPRDVQPAFTQPTHGRSRHVFISEVTHQLGRDRIDAHIPQGLGHIGITRL